MFETGKARVRDIVRSEKKNYIVSDINTALLLGKKRGKFIKAYTKNKNISSTPSLQITIINTLVFNLSASLCYDNVYTMYAYVKIII